MSTDQAIQEADNKIGLYLTATKAVRAAEYNLEQNSACDGIALARLWHELREAEKIKQFTHENATHAVHELVRIRGYL